MTSFERIVKGYAELVRSGKLEIKDVPEKYREAVRELLEQ